MGVAVLLAGALSMAMGEWIFVQSSRELYAYSWPSGSLPPASRSRSGGLWA
jgi:hypothetical protein